jgi:hypothetical protein
VRKWMLLASSVACVVLAYRLYDRVCYLCGVAEEVLSDDAIRVTSEKSDAQGKPLMGFYQARVYDGEDESVGRQ